MKTLATLGAVLVSLPIHTALALEPEEAGRQALEELDALMDKQRQEQEAASAKPMDGRSPSSPAARKEREAPEAIKSKIPTICRGC